MKRRAYDLVHLALILGFLAFWGCSTTPVLEMQDRLPGVVKEYKHVTLPGNRSGMRKTGIYLEKDQIYSILALGKIDLWSINAPPGFRQHDVKPEQGWILLARIGEPAGVNAFFGPLEGVAGSTLKALKSGDLYLGIKDGPVDFYGQPLNPQFYEDNSGSFGVDVIVWREENWEMIADFFKDRNQRDPKNKPV